MELLAGRYPSEAKVEIIELARLPSPPPSIPTGIPAEQLKDKCSICHDAWEGSVVVGECGHVFRAKCLLEWLPRAEDETCPTCRKKRFLFAS